MATFFIEQFGCRATQADAAAIERQLLDRGYGRSASAHSAEVVVVNTCTVTAAADLQARQAIHAIHRNNPGARIVATGCYAQRAPEELAALGGVAWVVGNSHKPEIPALIDGMSPSALASAGLGFVPINALGAGFPAPLRASANILSGEISERREFLTAPVEGGEAGHTRPVVKIQDGCDSRCAYCVIPLVRGSSRSLPPERVIEQIRDLTERGAREVVLSGIDLGSYGRDLAKGAGLGELLGRILADTRVPRLRFSSIEPMDVTEDFILQFLETDRLARHFHMPLQSGSDRILAAMRRWYRAGHYARHAEMIRRLLPGAAIGADVIAGFPGESEEDHRTTLAFIEQAPLTYLHVFSFSSRPGTPAASMPGQVPSATIARRARELRALGERKKTGFCAAQAGKTLRVLTLRRRGEDLNGPWTRAISGNNLDVRVAGCWPHNQFLDVRVQSGTDKFLSGAAI